MKKRILIILSFILLLLSPNLVSADCADLSRFTDWVREGDHTVLFYMEAIPLARIDIPYCTIHSSSTIRLNTFYVCDLDDLFVDEEACSVMTVEVLY